MGFLDRFKKKREEPEMVSADPDESIGRIAEENTEPDQEESWDSISLSMSKGSVVEESVFGDEPPGPIGEKTDSISNEEITKGITILDTYEVTSDAVKGGMGSVWKVRHNRWNKDLAMKRPQPKFFAEGSENRKKNFIHECEAWINLGLHPNIVSCYYVREIGGVPTIFSEWMENGSLENRIRDGSLYECAEAEKQARLLDIAVQFARGLHYAYEAGGGLIHQDVKPDNLLLTDRYEAKVADFGLARARAQMDTAASGESGGADGIPEITDAGATHMAPTGGYTPAYCSREQLLGETLTRRTDIYSWAVSVLEMYLGERPWKSGVEAGTDCETYFPQCLVPMPEALRELLRMCLKKDPADRPHDFARIEEDLKKIYKDVTGSDYPRPAPEAAADTADSLNNRALSYLDLGMEEDAENYWKEALEKTPEHLSSLYNQGLYLWRKGRIDDEEVLRRCSASRQSQGSEGLAGRWYEQISRERGVFEDVPFGESGIVRKWESVSYGSRPVAVLDPEGERLYLSGSRKCTPEEEEIRKKYNRVYEGRCMETGEWQTVFRTDTGCRSGIDLLEDGKTIRYLSPDNRTLYLADASDGTILDTHSFDGEVTGVRMHPDGRHLFISIGKTLQKWDRETWTLVKKWDAETETKVKGALPALYAGGNQRFSEDGTFFYQAGRGYFAEWDTETLALTRVAKLLMEGMLCRNAEAIYAPGMLNGELLICTPGVYPSSGKKTGIPLLSGERLIDGDGSRKNVLWLSKDETRLLAGNEQGRLKLVDPEDRRILCTWFGQTEKLSSAAASPDLSIVVSCCEDGTVRVFRGQEETVPAPWELSVAADQASVREKQKKAGQLAGQIAEMIEEGDWKQAAAVLFKAEELEGDEGSTIIRKLRRRITAMLGPRTFETVSEGGMILTEWSDLDPALSVAADPGSGGFCVGGFDNRMINVYGSDDDLLETLEFPYDGWSGYFLEYSRSGRYLIAGLNGMVLIRDGEKKNRTRMINGIPKIAGEGSRIAVSPDERRLLITGDDGYAVLYDLQNPTWQMPLKAGDKYLGNGCFSPDGKKIYLSAWDDDGWDPAVRVYDAETFECIRTVVLEEETPLFRIALEPGGKRLYISFGSDDRILLMDTETYEVSEGIRTGQDSSVMMRFDLQGRLLATASVEREGSIRIWSVPDLTLLTTLQPAEKRIGDLCFSADGCMMYACVGCNVQTWEIRWDLNKEVIQGGVNEDEG